MTFGALMLAALVATGLPLPWQVLGTVLSFTALAYGVAALRAVWRAGLRGMLVAALTIGLAVSATFLVSSLAMLATWPIHAERQACLARALTVAARDACEEQYRQTLEERLRPTSESAQSSEEL